jgi:hypothetical protein
MAPPLAAPKIEEPVESSSRLVNVICIPGALVRVYGSLPGKPWEYLGRGVGTAGPQGLAIVPISKKLQIEQRLRAHQILCGSVSGFGNEVAVVRPRPYTPSFVAPQDGNIIELTPFITLADPGANTEAAASNFEFTVTDRTSNVQVFRKITPDKTVTVAPALKFSTTYNILISSSNSTGHSGSTGINVTTKAEPPPRKTSLRVIIDPASSSAVGSQGRDVTIKSIEAARFKVTSPVQAKDFSFSTASLSQEFAFSNAPSGNWEISGIEFDIKYSDDATATLPTPTKVFPYIAGSPVLIIASIGISTDAMGNAFSFGKTNLS